MFTIRQRHSEALEESRREDFRRRAARSLRERFVDAREASREALFGFIDRGVFDGAAFGLYSEGEAQTFLDYRMIYGEAFPLMDETAWARAILEDERLDPDEKLRRIDEQFARLCLAADGS